MNEANHRWLGVDLGEVRIGLALSDALGITAQPLQTLQSVGPRRDVEAVARLADERAVDTVVIGLPRHLSGAEGEAAARARKFTARLRGRLPDTRVELWDERLTTAEVERPMLAAGVRRDRRKATVDALAATLILQSYLDAQAERRGAGQRG